MIVQSSSGQGQKLIVQFDYDAKNSLGKLFCQYYDITPYLVRKTILHSLKNGFEPGKSKKEMRLHKMWAKLDLEISGKRKTEKLLNDIEKRLSNDSKTWSIHEIEDIRSIIRETRRLIKFNEWYIGFELMLDNFYEIDIKLEKNEMLLVKEILKSKHINLKESWLWIDKMKKGKSKTDDELKTN